MAKQRRPAARPNSARRAAPSGHSNSNWQPSLLVAGAAVIAAKAALFVRVGRGCVEVRTEHAALAAENAAGANVEVPSGGRHAVYHSVAPLPTDASPRKDGKPTLVSSSGTWCECCEHVEPYAHSTASKFRNEMVFFEKSVHDDRSAAARYGLRGTPSFVLINASGQQITRFGFPPSDSAFASAVASALSRLSQP